MASPTQKRKSDFDEPAGSKKPKMSFAERMMAKMGHKKGEGLGKTGEGMLKPIEVQLRPQGVGVGAVREKTKQAREEAKRAAKLRGEEYEDSSDEERKARKRRQQQNRSGTTSGASTPVGRAPKTKYRSVAEMEAEGLHVPSVFKGLIDATGKQNRLLTSTAGLLTPGGTTMVPAMTEAEKIANRARRDLEEFARTWEQLKEDNEAIDFQERQVLLEIASGDEEIQRLQDVVEAVSNLSNLSLEQRSSGIELEAGWKKIVGQLKMLQEQFSTEIHDIGLSEVAVAALQPLFQKAMVDWEPLDDPNYLVNDIQELRTMLGISKDEIVAVTDDPDDIYHAQKRQKSTTPYESMIHAYWLPKIRHVITNTWDAHDPQPMLQLIRAWSPVLPPFILYNVINNLVVTKLSAAVAAWDPIPKRRRHRTAAGSEDPPHVWLFPWLPELSGQNINPKAPTGLIADVKRKLRRALDTWDLSSATQPMPGISAWRDVLGSELSGALTRHILPRLAQYLAKYLEIDPADQDLTPFTHTLAWTPYLHAKETAALLITEFFPKWHNTLHQWLTSSSADLSEIAEWRNWWRDELSRTPREVFNRPEMQAEWRKGADTINLAMQLGADAVDTLPLPAAGPARPLPSDTPAKKVPVAAPAPLGDEITLREVVERWCEEHGLFMERLGEAHPTNGAPLYRISATPKRGGATVYIRGDLVWAQDKTDKSTWRPVDLETELESLASGGR